MEVINAFQKVVHCQGLISSVNLKTSNVKSNHGEKLVEIYLMVWNMLSKNVFSFHVVDYVNIMNFELETFERKWLFSSISDDRRKIRQD